MVALNEALPALVSGAERTLAAHEAPVGNVAPTGNVSKRPVEGAAVAGG